MGGTSFSSNLKMRFVIKVTLIDVDVFILTMYTNRECDLEPIVTIDIIAAGIASYRADISFASVLRTSDASVN